MTVKECLEQVEREHRELENKHAALRKQYADDVSELSQEIQWLANRLNTLVRLCNEAGVRFASVEVESGRAPIVSTPQ